jgi:hypothetical protein
LQQFGLPAISVDATFADILDNFDFGFMGAAEARYGRFGILTDVMYVKLSADAPTPFGILADGVDVTSETFSMLVAGSYRLLESDQGHLDVLGGGRLWYVNTEVDLVNPIVPAPTFEGGDTWVDPIIGVQGRANLTPEVFLTGWAMIGGFGAASELTWDLMGGAGMPSTSAGRSLAGIGRCPSTTMTTASCSTSYSTGHSSAHLFRFKRCRQF